MHHQTKFQKTLFSAAQLVALLTFASELSIKAARSQTITPESSGIGTTVTPSVANPNQFDISGGTQAGQNLFHGFQNFGLNEGQIANFLSRPDIANILGRVSGGQASLINGLIQVTGGNSNLYLMNPAGIIFGQHASLNVPASFLATTANGIGFDNGKWFNAFGSNDYANLGGNPTNFAFSFNQPGAIVNAGNLTVPAGESLVLVGGVVVNTGTISAPGGNITIAAVAGQKLVRITPAGSLLSLELPIETQAQLNTSYLTPQSLPTLLTGTGGNIASATGMKVENGVVKLTSSGTEISITGGSAIASGTLNAASSNSLSPQISVLGEKVALIDATVNAAGTNGGGTVLIGGDYQGKGVVPNALNTLVDKNTIINADALNSGNGGRVIVWADNTTQFFGSISAKGGNTGGNGGFVEVSGKQNLQFNGFVNTSAVLGQAGTLLLDPANIIIATGGTALVPPTGAGDFTIDPTALQTALGTGNVTLQADNSITVNSPITWDSASNLYLHAGTAGLNGTVNLNAPITLPTLFGGKLFGGNGTNNFVGTVNVGAGGRIQNSVDVAATSGIVNLAAATFTDPSTITINKDLTVRGAGARLTTVSGNNVRQVFSITGGSVNLERMTVTGGNAVIAGGGISNLGSGTVTVKESTVSNNTTTVEGGGIANTGTGKLIVVNSTISNNSALRGGGIANLGLNIGSDNVTVNNSTISGNSSALGGGIANINTGQVTINNSTITGNTANLPLVVLNAGSGGGIANVSTGFVNVNNSIVAGNTGTIGAEVANLNAPIGNLTFNSNLIGTNGNSDVIGAIATNGVNGNIVPGAGVAINNILDPTLKNNGGQTNTHALVTGSLAINAGDNALAATVGTNLIDQRGGERATTGLNAGTRVDIGAYEATSSYVVISKTDDNGIGTLRSAIDFANANVNPVTNNPQDTIRFNIPGGGVQTITPTSPLPTVTAPIVVDGYSQPGASASPTNLLIQLNGAQAGAGTNGLVLGTGSDGSIIQGLIINAFNGNGISVQSDNNRIQGNIIGTNATGTAAIANNQNGVSITTGASGNIIGTNGDGVNDANEGNLISGNAQSGVLISGAGANNNVVAGNRIGTDATGTGAIPNGNNGIQINAGAQNNRIGTNGDGVSDTLERNIISGNTQNGVLISGTGTNNNQVAGNYIGTNAAGTGALANTQSGVLIDNNASNNTIGGTFANAGNTIANNGANGVTVVSGTGNGIRQNAIFNNNGIGIDLGNNGVTPNDVGDGDIGANNLQNTPTLTLSNASATQTGVSGIFNGAPGVTLTLEFFANASLNPLKVGQTYLGSTTITTDAAGNATYNVAFNTPVPVGQSLTATATDLGNNTSEFSGNLIVQDLPRVAIANVSQTEGSLTPFNFGVSLSANSALPVTINYSTASGTATSGFDYAATNGTLTYAPAIYPGIPALKTITVNAIDDNINEYNENFFVNLTNTNAVNVTATGTGTIINDDTPSISINNVSVNRGIGTSATTADFTLSLSNPTAIPVTVNLTTLDGTAIAGLDYTAQTGTFTFSTDTVSLSQTVRIPVLNNFAAQPSQEFFVTLSNPTNGLLASNRGTATLVTNSLSQATELNSASLNTGNITSNNSFSGSSSNSTTPLQGNGGTAFNNAPLSVEVTSNASLVSTETTTSNNSSLEESSESASSLASAESAMRSEEACMQSDSRSTRLLKQIDALLQEVSAHMNGEGGSISVDVGSIFKGCDPRFSRLLASQSGKGVYIKSVIGKYIGSEYASLINIRFPSIEAGSVLIVDVERSLKPAFVKQATGEFFYIREGNNIRSLPAAARQLYIQSRFGIINFLKN